LKSSEIISITLLVIAGFMMTEFIVDHLQVEGIFRRFVIRIGFQAQFFALIYLFFDYLDSSRRLRTLEIRFTRGKKANSKTRFLRRKRKTKNNER